MIITLPNIDGKIWNLEQHVIDIVHCVINKQPFQISLNNEGPDATKLGLYSLLDTLCDRYKFPKNQITITTCNQLELHPEYQVQKHAPLYIESAQQFAKQNLFPSKTFKQEFKHFGLFVGRSNWLRLWLASYLHNRYNNKTALTFHYNPTSVHSQDHLGLDDLIRFRPDLVQDLNPLQLIKDCPVIYQAVEGYPILTPAHFNISKIYNKFFLEVVCETYCQGASFYPTEKIWRPIINRTPFIVQGPVNYIDNLHRIGFKTFSRWFNESHSQDDYSYQPVEICATLDKIAGYSVIELEAMYIDMQDTLEHNYQVMMSMTKKKITEIFR